jgi:hypothetical protein
MIDSAGRSGCHPPRCKASAGVLLAKSAKASDDATEYSNSTKAAAAGELAVAQGRDATAERSLKSDRGCFCRKA